MVCCIFLPKPDKLAIRFLIGFPSRFLIFSFLTYNLSFFQPKPHLVKEIREALLRHLTAVLGNDGVAAHFMLLHLLSKVMVSSIVIILFSCILCW